MAGKTLTYKSLLEMARRYQVEENELFIAAAKQYMIQRKIINKIEKQLNEDGDLISTKEYVKGRENICAHPLVRELPKHVDSANKTMTVMMDIIKTFGKEPTPKGKLQELLADE